MPTSLGLARWYLHIVCPFVCLLRVFACCVSLCVYLLRVLAYRVSLCVSVAGVFFRSGPVSGAAAIPINVHRVQLQKHHL